MSGSMWMSTLAYYAPDGGAQTILLHQRVTKWLYKYPNNPKHITIIPYTAGVPIFNLGLKVFLNVNAKYNICLTI
jgi:hypothetical protein